MKKKITRKADAFLTRSNHQETAEEDEALPLFKNEKKQRPFLLSILFTSLKAVAAVAVVSCFGLFGLAVGVVKAYTDTAPTVDVAQLTISDRTSFLYDKNGALITSIADVEYRDWVDIENIPDMLQNAFVAVEDVRFYKHSGVDFKRLFSAALEILGNSNSSGGSTITQQLIKNKILGSQRNYKRKIQEAYLALKIEKTINKEKILEAYMNDIYLGESNYGVKTAAKDYFGKELSELTVRECAVLAGLPQAPYTYNPRRNIYVRNKPEITDNRTDHVLSKMYQAGYITESQYQNALNEKTTVLEISEQKQMYDMPYFVEYAIHDVVTCLLRVRGLDDNTENRNTVENELRTGGYQIYTTVDPGIQNTVQTTLSTWKKYPTLADSTKVVLSETDASGNVIETIQPQAAAVVLDYRTGEVRAVVGGRDEPVLRKSLNRAYQSYNEVGSAIKPLSVYGPALDLGLSAASIIPNMDGPIAGWTTETGYPSGGLTSRYGPVTLRRGVMSSLNVVAARVLMEYVTPTVASSYMEKLGANSAKINVDGPGLALGTSGLTPLQMAAAYGAIANNGVYLEPLAFTKVLDENGKVILDADDVRQTRRVYNESTAYMLVDILTDAVKSGTGTKAKIEGMTVAGKTGTNSDYASVYFAGITPYYCASVFIGHDYPVNKLKNGASGGDYAAPLFQAFMAPIHAGLENKPIIDAEPSDFGMVKKTVCSVSGMLATDACKSDDEHKPVTDWFLPENVPTEYCNMHVKASICADSGCVATSFCPSDRVTEECLILIQEDSQFAQFDDAYLYKAMPNFIRTEATSDDYYSALQTCTIHSDGSLGVFELKSEAESLLLKVEDYMMSHSGMEASNRALLQKDIDLLRAALSGYEYATIEPLVSRLRQDYSLVKAVTD